MKLQKLFIVDDQDLFREGISMMLERFDQIELIGQARSGAEFLVALDTLQPDIVLLDIDMPGISGEEACKIATERYENIKVIAVSSYSNEEYYYRMLDAGAKGYVSKQLSLGELLTAIEHVANGEFYFSDSIMQELLVRQPGKLKMQDESNTVKVDLTDHEEQLLSYISQGFTESEISNFSGLSIDTIQAHVDEIMKKTGSADHIQLIMYSITHTNVDFGLN